MENYYEEALKKGRKCFKQLVSKGEYPYLPVLDEILMSGESDAGNDIGIAEVPMEFIIGTKTRGRTRSFARNFMPIVEEKSEFSSKWKSLCESHLEEGIRDPVQLWEYMNRFYVQEGNKRVSVLKFFGAVAAPARIKRILPERNGDPDVERYYEFLDFCEKSGINCIELSKNGSYKELQAVLGKQPLEVWTEEETKNFLSVYYKFEKVYFFCGGGRLRSTAADALLTYIRVYGYKTLKGQSPAEIKKTISKLWDEIALWQEDSLIDVKLYPEEKPKPVNKAKLPLPRLIRKKPLKIVFFYGKGIGESGWDASHDAGREHIKEVFTDRIDTVVYIRDEALSLEDNLRKIIKEGARVIFAVESNMINACVKVAIEHPEVEILNCSLNKPHRFIRTYYPRMYEAKFVTGAIAGALSKNGKIGYISRFPIYGMTAGINAFARGVSLVNPRARIYLEWSSIGGITAAENRLKEKDIDLISYRDFYDQKPGAEVVLGLTDIVSGGMTPLVLPVWNWGIFYEKITASILKGSYREEYKKTSRSLNYYWGMSAGAVDIIFSSKLPQGVRYLGEILYKAVREGIAHPFYHPEVEKDGQIIWETSDRSVSAEEIITMDTLEDNIVGSIPEYHEIDEAARELVDEIGLESARREVTEPAGQDAKGQAAGKTVHSEGEEGHDKGQVAAGKDVYENFGSSR